ncbi:Acid ceramidase-like 2 [Homarus americanus]|uniref:Acid ceramidase n=1 Tax=Homarus americanus TaxID=6706 RepID=A0A8J5K129_HOMAM|nr:Acid ceramidase-like 2 [Homarus americanus]
MNLQTFIFFVLLSYTHAKFSFTDPFESCETNAFPPKQSDAAPRYIINLDLPPQERWTKLVTEKKNDVLALIGDIRNLTLSLVGEKVFKVIIDNLDKIATTLPYPFNEEIIGISKASGLNISEATLYNIFYEVFTFCTSIVAQDTSGHLYHGRNLDFGLFMGWNPKTHTWTIAELLKPLVVQLEWQKGGKTGLFTFSLDERFGLNGGFVGLLEWVSFLTREVMEEAKTYKEAKFMLSHTRLLAPVYFILGGVKSGEGSIITRWRDNFHTDDLLDRMSGSGSWFLVETNYDQWKTPPFFDDRRTPAVHCLNKGGQKNASPKLLYNVLSTRPVLNKLTTYTSLMDVNRGTLGAWLRKCEDPCWPW